MNNTKYSSPILLSGSVDLGPGETNFVPLEGMASRSRRWTLIDSMRVWAYHFDSTNFPYYFVPGASSKVRSFAYRLNMFNDFTRFTALGNLVHLLGSIESTSGYGFGVNPATVGYYHGRWLFPKPFLLPPGEALSVQFQRDGSAYDLLCPAQLRHQVSVTGKTVGKDEAMRLVGGKNPVPYLTNIDTGFVQAETQLVSNNLQLGNPFVRPFNIQRVAGAAVATATGQFIPTTPTNLTTLKLSDTNMVIYDKGPFENILSAQTNAWTFTRILQPTEYLKAELALGAPFGPSEYYDASLSLIGYRDEEIP